MFLSKRFYLLCWGIIISAFISCNSSHEVSTSTFIQKRKYRSGFSLSLKHLKNNHVKKFVHDKPIDKMLSDTDQRDNTPLIASIDTSRIYIPVDKKTLFSNQNKTILSVKKQPSLRVLEKHTNILSENSISNNKKPEYYGAAAFLSGMLTLASAISSFLGLGFFGTFTFGTFLPIIMGITTIILSRISFNKFRKFPGEYKGKGFTIIGLLTGLIFLIFGFIFLLLTILSVSGG